jgi:DHA1 family tetracycline resistance protein-like MFS transporter
VARLKERSTTGIPETVTGFMEPSKREVSRFTIWFILITSFLNLAGIGIINPVVPFIVSSYVERANAALVVALLFTTYSLCQFLAVPTLGALSDRFGRRPVMLVSLFGSAVGYFLFGIGGALWVLFLGRIIDGLTGGNIATIYAYAADITESKDRTRFFGVVGAMAGLGFVVGPAMGGIIYKLTGDVASPLYLSAVVVLLNTIWGYFVMPESLTPERRDTQINLARLNPFAQLVDVFRIVHLRLLLLGIFLWTLAFAMLQSNLSYLTEDRLGWSPDGTNAMFFVVGLVSIITQGLLVRRLLPLLGETRLALFGFGSQVLGFIIVVLVTVTGIAPLVFVAVTFVALGNGLITPSVTGLASQSVSVKEQGRVQGGNQAVQALGRVLGPLWGGWTYGSIGEAAPYVSGAALLGCGALAVLGAGRVLAAHKTAQTEIVASVESK